MKRFTASGLLLLVSAALTAFAAAASATTLTAPSGTALGVGKELHAVNEKGHVKLANPIANIECSSTVQGVIKEAGGTGNVLVEVSTWAFTGCTNSWHLEAVPSSGNLTVVWQAGSQASVTSTGTKLRWTRLGVKCVYETNNTAIGTLTDSNKTFATATLHVSASIPINTSESSALCGTASAKWEGAYNITPVGVNPDNLLVDQN